MKNYIFFIILFFFSSITGWSQGLRKNQVPSVILNNFQKSFSKAKDVEWEKKGENYKVEFEIGYSKYDHSVWYNKEGLLVRHKEEISKKDLPESIRSVINRDYKWYWIHEAEKITEVSQTLYRVELISFSKEWDLIFDETGKKVSEHPD